MIPTRVEIEIEQRYKYPPPMTLQAGWVFTEEEMAHVQALMSGSLPAHEIPITPEFQMGMDWGDLSYPPDLEWEAHQVDVENP